MQANPSSSAERVRRFRKRKKERLQESETANNEHTKRAKSDVDRQRICREKKRKFETQVNDNNIVQRIDSDTDDEANIVPEVTKCMSPFGTTVTGLIDSARNASAVFKRHYDFMVDKFFDDDMQNYCKVCDRIWWKSKLKLLSSVKKRCVSQKLKDCGYDVSSPTFTVCATCLAALNKNLVLQLSTVNGFVYPQVPTSLPQLSPLEVRLIAPRLPFMQIREIRYFPGSKKIIGQVINVPMDVGKTLNVLPRKLDDDATFNICLKRHILHRGSAFYDCISKRKLKIWIQYLVTTPLYLLHNVTVSEDFLRNVAMSYDDPNASSPEEEYHAVLRDEQLELNRAYNDRFIAVTRKHERRLNETEFQKMCQETLFWGEDLILHLAPTMDETPLSLAFDEYAEELAFPQIYYGQPRKFNISVTPFMMATSEIRRRDRRAVTSNKLYTVAKILRLRTIASFNQLYKTRYFNDRRITREDLDCPIFVRELMDRNESFLKDIPNSVQYWNARKNDLFAMMRQLGKPTLFMTLSASEIRWPHLLRASYRFQHCDAETTPDYIANDAFLNMSPSARAELINNDPVLCCLYFKRYLDTVICALKRANGPFGKHKVIDSFLRFEFQHRGSPHCHMLLWLDKVPQFQDIHMNVDLKPLIKVIDTLISVNSNELCSDRPLQTHNHTHTCYKKTTKSCRFGIPYWPMDQTRILTPIETVDREESLITLGKNMHAHLESTQYESLQSFLDAHLIPDMETYLKIIRHVITRATVFPKRSIVDIFTCPFNPIVSAVLQSNMDIQFILDPYACAAYVAEYINKSERGFSSLHRELIKVREDYPELDYDQCMKRLGINVLNKVEICAQEAAWILLRLPMSEMSRMVRFIPTQHPSKRLLVRKKKSQMDAEALQGSSTNVWIVNLVQRYETRGIQYSDIYLAKFIAEYTEVREKQINNNVFNEHESNDDSDIEEASLQKETFWRKRSDKNRIIKWCNYDKTADAYNYMREMVTLFIPFRNEELEILNNDNYIALYTQNTQLILERRQEYDSGLSEERVKALILAVQDRENAINAVVDKDDEGTVLHGPSVITVRDDYVIPSQRQPNNDDLLTSKENNIVRKVDNVMSHEDYCRSVRGLNLRQKSLILDFIVCLLYEKTRLMQIFFTGPAGSGKTSTLKVLMETCNRFTQRHNVNKNSYVACATTGKAAVNLNGTTVHSTFNISIDPKRRTLSGELKQTMRCDFHEVSLIIIDEVSMASSHLLNCINERLMSIGRNPVKTFGGFHVVLTGDLRQLPPVMASPIYTRPANILQDRMIWQQLDYYPLTEIMRQSDKRFSNVLTKVGNGDALGDRERRLLESRFIPMEVAINNEDLKDAVRLFFQNSDVDNYNYRALSSQPIKIIVDSRDEVLGDVTTLRKNDALMKLRKMSLTTTGNMLTSLILVIGRKYIVSQNTEREDGIVNGASGILRFVENLPDTDEPYRLWLEFERENTGAITRLKYKENIRRLKLPSNLTPILKRSAVITVSRQLRVRRTQFPVIPGEAITIHKAQGGSYDKVIYSYDKKHEIALVYVALSRARTLQGLYLVNKSEDHQFYHCKQANSRAELTTEFKRLDMKRLVTICERCNDWLNDANTSSAAPFAYLNCQSLNAHREDISSDSVFSKTPILALSETWMSTTIDPFDIAGFRCVARSRRPHIRAGGVAVYERLDSRFIQCTPVHVNMSSELLGDAVCVQVQRFDKDGHETQHFYMMTMYADPNISERRLLQLLHCALTPFNLGSRISVPLIVCGDFNFELTSARGNRISTILKNVYGIHIQSNLGPTTVYGTAIDAILYRGKRVECYGYVSYFSKHRPFFIKATNENCGDDAITALSAPQELSERSMLSDTRGESIAQSTTTALCA